jgi:nickel-type superoxide dismutase maturation protease
MREQRYHGRRRAILPALVLAVTVWWWWHRRPFRVAVEGESMLPTLAPGDFLVAVKASALRRGSLVVVDHPGRPGYEIVKRLAAVPGDEVGGTVMAPGEYWVLGDHPDGSSDSRQFGTVTEGAIRGVVRLRYWPVQRAGLISERATPVR